MSSKRTGKARRRENRKISPLLKIPFRQLWHPHKPYEILDPEQIEQLHEASMDILENVGIDFLDDETLDIWEREGAKVDRSARHVWPDRDLIMEKVARAPDSLCTWAR